MRPQRLLFLALATTVGASALTASKAPAAPPTALSASTESKNGAPSTSAERSAVPTVEEWLRAEAIELTRMSVAAKGCASTRVREWVRVRCPIDTFAISLLGGTSEGLAFWIGPEEKGRPGEVQFPTRRGDRRIVQFWVQGKDAEGGVVPTPSLVLQEHWIDGETTPTITVL